jgi:hypothetical protein
VGVGEICPLQEDLADALEPAAAVASPVPRGWRVCRSPSKLRRLSQELRRSDEETAADRAESSRSTTSGSGARAGKDSQCVPAVGARAKAKARDRARALGRISPYPVHGRRSLMRLSASHSSNRSGLQPRSSVKLALQRRDTRLHPASDPVQAECRRLYRPLVSKQARPKPNQAAP